MKSTKKMVLLALMVSQALVLSIIESWIPVPAPAPGVKLGLANIVTMMAIVFFNPRETLLIVAVRCALASIYGGGFVVFLFSITGGILSAIVMSFLYKRFSGVFSITGISIAGAVSHNIGQLIVAGFILKEMLILTYLPVLVASGAVMGCFVGLCSSILTKALRKTDIFAKEN